MSESNDGVTSLREILEKYGMRLPVYENKLILCETLSSAPDHVIGVYDTDKEAAAAAVRHVIGRMDKRQSRPTLKQVCDAVRGGGEVPVDDLRLAVLALLIREFEFRGLVHVLCAAEPPIANVMGSVGRLIDEWTQTLDRVIAVRSPGSPSASSELTLSTEGLVCNHCAAKCVTHDDRWIPAGREWHHKCDGSDTVVHQRGLGIPSELLKKSK